MKLAPRPSTLALAMVAVALFAGGCAPEPTRDEAGAITDQQDASVHALRIGDCLAEQDEDTEVESVEAIPCDEEHGMELYAATKYPEGDYPGEGGVIELAEEFCLPEFESFVGLAYDDSTLEIMQFYPTSQSWGLGDRTLQCLITDPEGPVTGSLESADR